MRKFISHEAGEIGPQSQFQAPSACGNDIIYNPGLRERRAYVMGETMQLPMARELARRDAQFAL